MARARVFHVSAFTTCWVLDETGNLYYDSHHDIFFIFYFLFFIFYFLFK